MEDKKDFNNGEHRSSVASSQASIRKASYAGKSSFKSRASSTATTSSSSSIFSTSRLSHTLSKSGADIDDSKRIRPVTFARIDNLKVRLMPKSTQTSKAARLYHLDRPLKDHEHLDARMNKRGEPFYHQPKDAPMPTVCRSLALELKVRDGNDTQKACIQLSNCRMLTDTHVASYIVNCFKRLLEHNASQTYINLPPCFHLKHASFDLGLRAGWATFAWFCFDSEMAYHKIPSARLVGINNPGYEDNPVGPNPIPWMWNQHLLTLRYDNWMNGKNMSKTLQADYRLLLGGAAFPEWLGVNDWHTWLGQKEVAQNDPEPFYKNFEARNIRLDFFGNFTRGELVRAPGAPTSLPEVLPVPEKKRRLFVRNKNA